MDDEAREEWLRSRQNGRVYPLGRALRHTYDADNHETLGDDVTGLMIDLSKMPYEPAAPPPPPPKGHPRAILAKLLTLIRSR